ncbi:MAG: nucleoside triphosphate pyrophosphohydrolase, partial [Rhodospirillaceae bacterium]|nr:nucleoside triphosphate pyrophosphohydrolase [Rhodospirillaceae bacterium]
MRIDKLLEIMSKLRNPETGCPWDVVQTFETIAPYTLEEAYEVREAISNGDYDNLRDELGDLLLQVVFHSQIASEANLFTFDQVVESVSKKMIDRHPHVFGNKQISTVVDQLNSWEEIKAKERELKEPTGSNSVSAIDGVSAAYPALLRAEKLQKRAARVGFDWNELGTVLDKLEEEILELKEALDINDSSRAARLEEELGDILF